MTIAVDMGRKATKTNKQNFDGFHALGAMGLNAMKPVFVVSDKTSANQSPQLQRLARKLKFRL